jgi:ankyrin repeat protein
MLTAALLRLCDKFVLKPDIQGFTPLHHAVIAENNVEAVDELLSSPGIELSARDQLGCTPLD